MPRKWVEVMIPVPFIPYAPRFRHSVSGRRQEGAPRPRATVPGHGANDLAQEYVCQIDACNVGRHDPRRILRGFPGGFLGMKIAPAPAHAETFAHV